MLKRNNVTLTAVHEDGINPDVCNTCLRSRIIIFKAVKWIAILTIASTIVFSIAKALTYSGN